MAAKEVRRVTDTVSKVQRSKNMRAVRSHETGPEMAVRRLLHRLGYRFRLHRRDLPGTPDVVFVSLRRAIFVHGCFWHQHRRCSRGSMPASNIAFWRAKLEGNRARDARNLAKLRELGWKPLVVWECETKNLVTLSRRLRKFLRKPTT
ncbi:MAG TPA: very short patch repair endonuclease [Terriglobia bacterium]|nr:very short patch repair endonuclease [Terriglobia bacterium]